MTFKAMVAILAAKRCALAGMSIKEIAAQAHKSERTVRRWVKL